MNREFTCGPERNLPASNVGVVRVVKPLKATAASQWSIDGGTNSGVLPGYGTTGHSAEVGQIPANLDTVNLDITGAEPGDTVDLIALPNPAGDVLLCYDGGMSANTGTENKPIPRKFSSADHYVRQRPDKTLTLRDMFVSGREGLAAIKDRDVTLIMKVYPDGGGVPSEIRYFTNVRFSVPLEIPQDGNESIMSTGEGSFEKDIILSSVV